MSRSAFFRQGAGAAPLSTLALILADGSAGTANVANAPDLVVANTETYLATGGGTLTVVSSPPPARGSGALRSLNGSGGEQTLVSRFPAPFNALTNSWTFELWGRWTEWPDALPAGQIIFGGLHNALQDIRTSGWKISVCNGSAGTGVVVSFSPNDVASAPDDGFSYLADASTELTRPRSRFFASAGLATNTWYHFCMMWDALLSTMYVYRDGVLLGSWVPTIANTSPVFAQDRLTNCNAIMVGRPPEYVAASLTAQTLSDQIRMSRGLRYATAGFSVPAGVFSVD